MIQSVCLYLFQLAGCKQKNICQNINYWYVTIIIWIIFNTLKGQLFDESNKGNKKIYEIEEV